MNEREQGQRRGVNYQGREIAFRLLFSRRRGLGLCLDPEVGLVVRAPLGMDPARVDDLVLAKAPWVLKHLESLARRGLPPPPRAYHGGEVFAFQGRDLVLEVLAGGRGGRARVEHLRERLVVVLGQELGEQARPLAVRRALGLWYRRQAALLLPPRAVFFARALGLATPPPVLVRDQKRRWGSCNAKGELRLNWRLVMAPPELYDYVAAHEACHLRVPDHSPSFWGLLASLVPDCRARRRRLNQLGPWLRL
ncbi:MAG: SprT family zinc-dependent metalloprotease [Pseudomonadota bacterium]